MKYCGNCGTKVDENQNFCPKCGAALNSNVNTNIPKAISANITQNTIPNMAQAPAPYQRAIQNPGSFTAQSVNDASLLEKMSLGTVVLLFIVTFGIYGLYYLVRLEKETSIMLGRHTTSSGSSIVLYSFLSGGIYTIWFYNKMAAALDEAMDNRHMIGGRIGSGVGFVIMLLIPFIGLLALYKIIDAHNSIIDCDRMAKQTR